ncbi:unnamed protein product [Sphagnum tenellum]
MVWTIPVGIQHFQAVVTVSFESKLQSSLLFLLFDVCTRTLFLLLFAACWKKRERERERSERESCCDVLFFLRNMDGGRIEEALVELWNNRTSPSPIPMQPNVEISSSVNLVSVNAVLIIAERHHGVLFNETPPPPKQKMKWEDLELPYYATGIIAVVLLAVGLSTKPDTRIETWARKQALERLAAEEEE